MSFHRKISVGIIASLGLIVVPAANVNAAHFLTLHGSVQSDETGLEGYEVSFVASFVGPVGHTRVLGSDTTGPFGEFKIDYRLPRRLPSRLRPILFVRAQKGPAMLAGAIGRAPVVGPVVVNELTTVATGFAFAQFVDGKVIKGNRYGMRNAVHMAANLADPKTGEVAEVLERSPNGDETEARPTFYSLANIVAGCIATQIGCEDLLDATTLPGGTPPTTVLQAVANIAKYPWLNVSALFDLSFEEEVYGPALLPTEQPDAWTLFLKFTGSFSSVQDENNLMNGPGAIAIDRKGFLWVNDNYVPQPPHVPACDGKRLIKFYPWGENFPGSPYFGGGLSGAGFGITLDSHGLIWVGNFGFSSPIGCPLPPADSVSLFLPNGRPLSPRTGFRAGPISWPQATVSDTDGNIWIANCAAGSVTIYPNGRPRHAFETVIQEPTPGAAPMKPFGLAIDDRGRAWVSGSGNSTLAVIDPDGELLEVIPGVHAGRTQLRRPMGVASDSRGNIWVSNSDFVDVVCPLQVPDFGTGAHPSVALFRGQPGKPARAGEIFEGGGITIPWGIAVDGDDTVWVANFSLPFTLGSGGSDEPVGPNRVSHFCGVDTSKCPPTKQAVGQAISPDGTGYTSSALARNTGLSIDPSGNVWLANNWKLDVQILNPGGNSIAVLIGAAAPVKTPLIGTPRSFNNRTRNHR